MPLGELAPELTRGHEDWQLFLRLAAYGDVAGFVTNDDRLLRSPMEMFALRRTRLCLIVTAGVGHDPIRATGLVMAHLTAIHRDGRRPPSTYRLRPSELGRIRRTPGQQLDAIASGQGMQPSQLIRRMEEFIHSREGRR